MIPLYPLGSRDEGSFVTVKLDPPPFLGEVPLSWYTGVVLLLDVIGLSLTKFAYFLQA